MKSVFLIIGVFFLSNIHAQSKPSFSGKVTDAKTGEPLPGASIYFHDLKTGASTNSEGTFTISSISGGKHLVEVSHLGYSSVIETIDLSSTTKKDFALGSSVIENEGVTITGVSTATSTKTTPVPINIIRREDLLRNTATNLIDNIAKTPGVSQVSTGPAVSKPFIRGLGYNRVVVVDDGVRHEGQQWGDEHGVEIDELSVNRVEVLKGPASLMYGSDALAGVVNITSVPQIPEGAIRGNILAAYQTNNRQRNLHLDLGGNQKGFTWGVYGSYKAAADYKNKYDGYVFNSKFNEKNFGGYIGVNKSWGYSRILFSNFNQQFGLIEGERDATTGQFIKLVNNNGTEEEAIATNKDFKSSDPLIPHQHLLHLKVASDNSFNIGKDRLTAVVAYQHDQRKEIGNVLDPNEKELFFDLNVINYNLQYHLAEKNNWRTSIGVNGMQQTHENKGVEALIPDYSLFDIGAFLYTRKKINQVTLSGGVRFDNRSVNSKEMGDGPDIKFASFKKDFSNVSGSVGLAWEASKMVTLKFNVARGFRAPTLPELSSNGAHEGTNRFEYGEQDLKSETSLQTDAGVTIASEHVSFNASVFYNSLNNFIYYSKLAATGGGDSIVSDGGEDFFAFQFTQANARLYGLEFNLDFHPHPLDWLHVENTFSWVRGQLKEAVDGSKNLPFIPAARLINEVKVDLLKKGKIVRDVFLTAELDNTFDQKHPFTGFNTETATKGYSLFNAGFGGDIRSKNKTLFTLLFSANNIMDVAYQNHLSRLKYTAVNAVTGRMGVFNMGRNFSMKLNIPLEF